MFHGPSKMLQLIMTISLWKLRKTQDCEKQLVSLIRDWSGF